MSRQRTIRPVVELANSFVKYATDNMILNQYEIGLDYRLSLVSTERLNSMFHTGITKFKTDFPKVSHSEILHAIGDSIKNGGYPLQFRHDLCIIFYQVIESRFDILNYVMSPTDESDIFAIDVVDEATHTIQYPQNTLTFRREFNQKLNLLMQRRTLLPVTIMHSVGNRIGILDEPLRTELCHFFQNNGVNFNFLEWVSRTPQASIRVHPNPRPPRVAASLYMKKMIHPLQKYFG